MRIFSKLLPASKQKLVISSIGIVVLLAFASFILFQATQAEVVVAENGKDRTIDTHADTVEELLAEAGITIGEHDVISHDLSAAITDGMRIEYLAANEVVVSIDGNEEVYYTVAGTVEEFLNENELTVSEHDEVSQALDATIKDGLKLTISKAFEVTIQDGGEEVKAWSTGGSVADVLAANDITLAELDQVKPAKDEAVTKDTAISIVRIEKKTEEVTDTIAFKTETRTDSSMTKGQEKVLAAGVEGEVVKQYEVTYENGKEVKRELLEEEVIKESENRVVVVGTKQQNLVTLSSGSEPAGGKEFTMTASAFTAECSGCSGFTTTGINLNANPNMKVIAVDPSVIPLGTKVWVQGYGEAIAGDTGGHINGNRIDVHVPTKADAYQWGVRKVKVKIID
ncbi:G5 and 3D domain-containing protein [Ornithinibacillus contaminans]|uniref:G5 and 3D domain-containing protein n=1 Tax=Ornithinibacillus contaminans TaxID=694055 RepID=UPI00064DA965|nr:G5 and 3D domain-containing protein [Ornithinibacillus contaminans]